MFSNDGLDVTLIISSSEVKFGWTVKCLLETEDEHQLLQPYCTLSWTPISSPEARPLSITPRWLTSDTDMWITSDQCALPLINKAQATRSSLRLISWHWRAHRLALSPCYPSAASECIKRVCLQLAQSDDILVSKVRNKYIQSTPFLSRDTSERSAQKRSDRVFWEPPLYITALLIKMSHTANWRGRKWSLWALMAAASAIRSDQNAEPGFTGKLISGIAYLLYNNVFMNFRLIKEGRK